MARVSPHVATVLLVDSTQDDRTMYAEYLQVCGLKPIEIDNTADALNGATKADVIVTGIRVAGVAYADTGIGLAAQNTAIQFPLI